MRERPIAGLVASNFCFDYATHVLYCIAFGLTSGAYIGLAAVILLDLIGPGKFVQACGIQLLFMGVGIVIGPPVIGECQGDAKRTEKCRKSGKWKISTYSSMSHF